jgi:hypothetical protein
MVITGSEPKPPATIQRDRRKAYILAERGTAPARTRRRFPSCSRAKKRRHIDRGCMCRFETRNYVLSGTNDVHDWGRLMED